jgi:hypothetical protein
MPSTWWRSDSGGDRTRGRACPASIRNSGLPSIAVRPLRNPTPEIELAIAYRKTNRSKPLGGLVQTDEDVARAQSTAQSGIA